MMLLLQWIDIDGYGRIGDELGDGGGFGANSFLDQLERG